MRQLARLKFIVYEPGIKEEDFGWIEYEFDVAAAIVPRMGEAVYFSKEEKEYRERVQKSKNLQAESFFVTSVITEYHTGTLGASNPYIMTITVAITSADMVKVAMIQSTPRTSAEDAP